MIFIQASEKVPVKIQRIFSRLKNLRKYGIKIFKKVKNYASKIFIL